MNRPNVDIVIVTYNRLAKLQYALECYDKQTMPFRTLIVVDNNSTDGTKEEIENIPQLEVFLGNGSLFYSGGMRLIILSWQMPLFTELHILFILQRGLKKKWLNVNARIAAKHIISIMSRRRGVRTHILLLPLVL